MLKRVDDRQNLAELAFNLRYTIHEKKARPNKVFNIKKEEERVRKLFREETNENPRSSDDMAERIRRVNEHFTNK